MFLFLEHWSNKTASMSDKWLIFAWYIIMLILTGYIPETSSWRKPTFQFFQWHHCLEDKMWSGGQFAASWKQHLENNCIGHHPSQQRSTHYWPTLGKLEVGSQGFAHHGLSEDGALWNVPQQQLHHNRQLLDLWEDTRLTCQKAIEKPWRCESKTQSLYLLTWVTQERVDCGLTDQFKQQTDLTYQFKQQTVI